MPKPIKIDFWNVGQGDASSILLPDGSFDIIDVGKHNNQLVYFFQQRKSVVNKLILTHNDSDHCGALKALLENQTLTIGEIYILDDGKTDNLPWQQIFKKVGEKNCSRLEASSKTSEVLHSFNDYKLSIKYPSFTTNVRATSANETSAIIVLEKDNRDIIAWGADNNITTISLHIKTNPNLLFGPHHGAPGIKNPRQLQATIFGIKPSQCLLSFGTRNSYDHPHKEYLEALIANKVHVICLQKARKCSPGNTSAILNGDALYGLYQPREGVPCHGHVRMILDDISLQDEYEELFIERKGAVLRRLCNT